MTTFYQAGPQPLTRMRRATTPGEFALVLYCAIRHDRRNNGEVFAHLDDSAPEWCRDVVRKAHGDFLPDDQRYDMINAILGSLCDRDESSWDDDRGEIVDGCVDVYTSQLTAWLASHIDRVAYLEAAVRDFGAKAEDGSLLPTAQYCEIDECFGLLVDALREQAESEA